MLAIPKSISSFNIALLNLNINSYLKSESICAGCKKSWEDHGKYLNAGENFHNEFDEWTSENCTQTLETDFFGKIRFPGSRYKSAKVSYSF